MERNALGSKAYLRDKTCIMYRINLLAEKAVPNTTLWLV